MKGGERDRERDEKSVSENDGNASEKSSFRENRGNKRKNNE